MLSRRVARPLGAFAKEWTCPSCTRASPSIYSRAIVQQTQHRAFSRSLRRDVRPTPELVYEKEFSSVGVPGLFSDVGFRLGWKTYQEMMLQKLDQLLAGEPEENSDVKALLLKYARDPENASVFNHASMAFNNHFFYQALSTSPLQLDRYKLLEQSLIKTFGSIDTLRTTFIDTANAMFAPGFVWLVWCKDAESPRSARTRGAWRILTTYAAGTPFPEAGYRQQGIDTNNSSPASYDKYRATNPLGSFGSHSQLGQEAAKIPPGGTSVAPVLCVSTWEHSYIYDFGLPKRHEYLSTWWDCIDWYRVEQRTPKEAQEAAGRSLLG